MPLNMVGRRLALEAPPEGQACPADAVEGDYWRDTYGVWWAFIPRSGVGRLDSYVVDELPDRTITVRQIISVPSSGYIGRLIHGVWHECP